jgi:hypothetical protein
MTSRRGKRWLRRVDKRRLSFGHKVLVGPRDHWRARQVGQEGWRRETDGLLAGRRCRREAELGLK